MQWENLKKIIEVIKDDIKENNMKAVDEESDEESDDETLKKIN